MSEFLVVTHFHEDDPEFLADYWDIQVFFKVGGKDILIREYGDAYHDAGRDKLRGFIEGVNWAWGSDGINLVFTFVNVADRS